MYIIKIEEVSRNNKSVNAIKCTRLLISNSFGDGDGSCP